MTITLTDLPEEVEQFIRAKATEQGAESVEAYVRSLLVREAESQERETAIRKPTMGLFSHLGVDITERHIKDMRKEALRNFPRDIA